MPAATPRSETNEILRVKTDGFTVIRDGEHAHYDDQHVAGMKLTVTRESNLIGEEQTRQELRLRLLHGDQQTTWVRVVQELGPFDDDRLKDFRSRLLDSLAKRSWQELRRGGEIHGEDWSLDLIGLTHHPTGTHCLIQQLCGASWKEEELWLHHEDYADRPFLRIPIDRENTALLHRILQQLVANVDDADLELTAGLGKQVARFETQHRPPLPYRRMAGGACVVLSFLICTVPLQLLGLGAVLVFVTALAALPLLRSFSEVLLQYEFGLIWHSGRHEHVMLFEQIEEMRVLSDGGPRRHAVDRPTMLFEFAESDPSEMPIRMPVAVRGTAARNAAESLCLTVASHLADRMEVRLAADGQVNWTERLTLFRDSLVYQNEEVVTRIPFADIGRVQVADDRITMLSQDGDALLNVANSEWNFYPGYTLFERLRRNA